MAKQLTKEQYLELMDHIEWDESGKANKKCPLCGNDIVVEPGTVKCKTHDCIVIENRGI